MEDTEEQHPEIASDVRLARILLPAALLREVDQLVLSGRGGYATRQEFFLEAIQNHVMEVKHGPAVGGQLLLDADLASTSIARRPLQTTSAINDVKSSTRAAQSANGQAPSGPAVSQSVVDQNLEAISDLARTALKTKTRGQAVSGGIARFKQEPLLGLHNRDYPSLWALSLLAEMAYEEPVPAPLFVEEATRQAWRYAQALGGLEKRTKIKLTALFPTNMVKPQSAEEGFRAFAIGTIARKPGADGHVDTSGPLFSWQAAQLVKPNGTIHIGLTPAGWELTEAMLGLTLDWPHGREFAERFFAYLREHAPWDWSGFDQILSVVSESPTRPELAARFASWQPEWTSAMANTTSSGYIARARAWGVVEPKMIEGRYALTDFGRSMLRERSTA